MVDGNTDDRVVNLIASIVGSDHCLTDADLRAPYERDWTGRYSGDARLVVRPGTVDEVAAVAKVCAAEGLPIVPQGGNTGLVGGGVPRGGEVVLSLRRLNAIGEFDHLSNQVTVGAGCTLGDLQRAARLENLEFPVDIASRDSATVGGMVATNAGGVLAMRYGPMRRQVAGVQAVTTSGVTLHHLAGLPKDNSGYHFPSLLAGSEGTLAILTAIRLRLIPSWKHRVTCLIAVADTQAMMTLGSVLRDSLPTLEVLEGFYADGLQLVVSACNVPMPFAKPYPAYLLFQCASMADSVTEIADVVEQAPGVLDVAVAVAASEQARLWSYRERHTEAISTRGVPHKLDVSVPLSELAAFETDIRREIVRQRPNAEPILFGHVGDGNLHVNILGLDADDFEIDEMVFHMVRRFGGSISAEHGIGTAKAPWLHLMRSDEDIAIMRGMKAAWDPLSILNPGVLFSS